MMGQCKLILTSSMELQHKHGMRKIEIIEENRVFNSYFKVDEALVSHTLPDGKRSNYIRMRLDRPNASVILLYNPRKDVVILVKQFRYPVLEEIKKSGGNIETGVLEAVAGKIDEGETPREAALRELTEEVGYKITDKRLISLSRGYSTPGYSSEIIYNFAAVVYDKDKIEKGGGKEGEFEDIEIIEMPYLQFRSLVETGSLQDMKTRLVFYEASHYGIFNSKIEKPKKTKPTKIDDTQLNLYGNEQN